MRTTSAIACALVALGGTPGCSAVLDWSGYAGGDAGSGVTDAGDGGRDGAPVLDAGPPRCSPSNCGGCCNTAGFCAGGQSKDTCGAGGEACVDCVLAGLTCSDGKCVAPVADAGPPPPCDPMTCPFDCAPVYQTTCCKGDDTCGCQVQIPTTGPCM